MMATLLKLNQGQENISSNSIRYANKILTDIIRKLEDGIVSNVTTLPEQGEDGKIYYNKADGKFYICQNDMYILLGSIINVDAELPNAGEPGIIYCLKRSNKDKDHPLEYTYHIWNGDDFVELSTNKVIRELNDNMKVRGSSPGPNAPAQILTNTYQLHANYFYNIANWDMSEGTDTSMTFRFISEGIYAGRFTAWANDMTITWPTGVIIPDSVDTTIINGHTYEFNVWQDVLILTDITATGGGA